MDKDELQFESKKKVIESFKADLKSLMDKYNFGREETDQYDGEEEYCGTDYYFTVNGDAWYVETIAEILDDIVGPF